MNTTPAVSGTKTPVGDTVATVAGVVVHAPPVVVGVSVRVPPVQKVPGPLDEIVVPGVTDTV
jgi:hypothetical protein